MKWQISIVSKVTSKSLPVFSTHGPLATAPASCLEKKNAKLNHNPKENKPENKAFTQS